MGKELETIKNNQETWQITTQVQVQEGNQGMGEEQNGWRGVGDKGV